MAQLVQYVTFPLHSTLYAWRAPPPPTESTRRDDVKGEAVYEARHRPCSTRGVKLRRRPPSRRGAMTREVGLHTRHVTARDLFRGKVTYCTSCATFPLSSKGKVAQLVQYVTFRLHSTRVKCAAAAYRVDAAR